MTGITVEEGHSLALFGEEFNGGFTPHSDIITKYSIYRHSLRKHHSLSWEVSFRVNQMRAPHGIFKLLRTFIGVLVKDSESKREDALSIVWENYAT